MSQENLEPSMANMPDIEGQGDQPPSASTTYPEDSQQPNAGRTLSTLETHTVQIQMLAEFIETRINKAFETITLVSNIADERSAHSKAHCLELKLATDEIRNDLDSLQACVQEFIHGKTSDEKEDDRSEVFKALSNIQSDIEAIRNEHHAALNAIQAQKEQHRHLHTLYEELHKRVISPGGSPKPSLSAPMDDEEEADTQLQALLTDHRRQQGEQLQDLETQLVQHLQGVREQQLSDASLLCQNLERRQLGLFQAERERTGRLTTTLLQKEKEERMHTCKELDTRQQLAAEREKEERVRAQSDLDARQQRAIEETFRAVNLAIDGFRAEMRELKDQGPNSKEVERMVASAVRQERDDRAEAVRADLARIIDTERNRRRQDLEVQEAIAGPTLPGSVTRVKQQAEHDSGDQYHAKGRVSGNIAKVQTMLMRSLQSEDAGRCAGTQKRSELLAKFQDIAGNIADIECAKAADQSRELDTAVDNQLDELGTGVKTVDHEGAAHEHLNVLRSSIGFVDDHEVFLGTMLRDYARQQDLDALSSTLGAECDARLRENSALRVELGMAVEKERVERVAQVGELLRKTGMMQTGLAEAIAAERNERITEISEQREEMLKVLQQWHEFPQDRPPDLEKEGSGLFSRLFTKAKTATAET